MPLVSQDEDSRVRPSSRADMCKKRQRVPSPETLELHESSDSSSDVEYFITHRATPPQSAQRVFNTARPVVDTKDDPELDSVHVREPEPDHVSKLEHGHDTESELDTELEDDKDSENESIRENDLEVEGNEEDNSELEAPEDVSESNVESEQEESQAEVREDRGNTRAEPRPKRAIEPTIRLTYDEPGKSSDRPLTIVHRGLVIKIGKH